MVVGLCQIELHLPDSRSLKDKRSVIHSLIARLHNEFNISCAEIDHLDAWHSAGLGLAVVSNEVAHAQKVLSAALRWIEVNRPDLLIIDHSIEIIQ
jgi:hypothetical protein